MALDTLRTGWPEQILTGRYSFRTRGRDGLAAILAHGVEIITDDLIEPRTARCCMSASAANRSC